MITASLGMPQIMVHIPRSVAKYLQFSFAAVVQRPSVINSRSTALFRLWFARYTATIFILKFAGRVSREFQSKSERIFEFSPQVQCEHVILA